MDGEDIAGCGGDAVGDEMVVAAAPGGNGSDMAGGRCGVVKVVDKAVCNVVIVMLADMVEAAVMLRSARSLFKCQTKAPLITM
ncbi:hypothetical protein PF010_g12212 [Phytophthora fragariae]|uniref:Uncharacterized protein n=1 Tax=Phytophthora fragariae TaxID=53985 RepID=A0A6G0L3Q0_9STRA|nr:hypothetical protein PF010_g12212 [Phytophthora fragariae]